MSTEPDILVVDDENQLADLYTEWLQQDGWSVETAYDGESALEKLTASIEIVLLDRRMPDQTGEEVLETIRDNGYDVRVVMATAVDPDFDIIEMGFDDYLVKPLSEEELLTVVDHIDQRATYESEVQTYYTLVSKKALIESKKSAPELEGNEEYQTLCTRVEELEERTDATVSSLRNHDEFVGVFQDISSEN
ncbi:HalX domain-containing protein [Natronorubrum daqingense]|uniref:HoxA transcriptional regulator n=1 Tax=Natronorubrum daqingense TaxID=588898 RepID=A0A1N6ZQ56_9EURY|nr:HalX domain-containing protein [Natronorubrum daqingense]APX95290.1 HoxA transcriptional regulator [Natronorubrum daqingense]SIR28816.1 Response regulator receiver domain-containing protein [Natronorubrum daqingense]